MRVLLISTNQLRPEGELQWVPVAPLGLSYVASALREAGHEIAFLDLCFEERAEQAVSDIIREFDPASIGISFRNLEMMAYFRNISFLDGLRDVVSCCRRHSDARIVLGGSGFSIMPVPVLRYTGCEFGIVGEGEWSYPELLRCLESGAGTDEIPGVVRIDGDEARIHPPRRDHSLGGLIPPARELIDHGRYIRAGGTANLQTKRGCPFECVYCTYPLIEGRAVRCRPPGEVIDEFSTLDRTYGLHEAYVVDSQFNYPLDYAKTVCERLITVRNSMKVWWTCMLNPGYVDEELALMLRLARCSMVDLSIESASDTMLERLGKGFTTADIRKTFAVLHEYRLPFSTWILFGGPGENATTVKETLSLLAELGVPRVLFAVGIRVCPRTALAERMREEGALAGERDLLEPVFYPSMAPEEIVELIRPYCVERPDWRIAAHKFAAVD